MARVVPWAVGVAVALRSRGAVARRRRRGAARGLLGHRHGDSVAVARGCSKGTSGQETGGEERAERHVGLETNGLESEKDAGRLTDDGTLLRRLRIYISSCFAQLAWTLVSILVRRFWAPVLVAPSVRLKDEYIATHMVCLSTGVRVCVRDMSAGRRDGGEPRRGVQKLHPGRLWGNGAPRGAGTKPGTGYKAAQRGKVEAIGLWW